MILMKKIGVITLIFISMFCLTGCFLSEEEYQNLRKIREESYKIYKSVVYDAIDSRETFSDINYMMEGLVVYLNRETQPVFSVELSPEGGIYWSRWDVYMDYGVNTFKLFYLEVDFNYSMRWTNKSCGTYYINGA